jgi:hypothetical protein
MTFQWRRHAGLRFAGIKGFPFDSRIAADIGIFLVTERRDRVRTILLPGRFRRVAFIPRGIPDPRPVV